jgi:hypothetical protein
MQIRLDFHHNCKEGPKSRIFEEMKIFILLNEWNINLSFRFVLFFPFLLLSPLFGLLIEQFADDTFL